MGAVAGMVVFEDTARFAYRQGLFVLAHGCQSHTGRRLGCGTVSGIESGRGGKKKGTILYPLKLSDTRILACSNGGN